MDTQRDMAELMAVPRGLLAEAGDPDSEFVITPGTRHRVEAAALALEAMPKPSEDA